MRMSDWSSDVCSSDLIQGEEPYGFSASVTERTFHRVRPDPNGGLFTDLMVPDHGVSSLTVSYALPRMYSTAYDVYWRALNDCQANVFAQPIGLFGFDLTPSEAARPKSSREGKEVDRRFV